MSHPLLPHQERLSRCLSVSVVLWLQDRDQDQVYRCWAASCFSSPVFSALKLGFLSTTPPPFLKLFACCAFANIFLPLSAALPSLTPASIPLLLCLETEVDQLDTFWFLGLSSVWLRLIHPLALPCSAPQLTSKPLLSCGRGDSAASLTYSTVKISLLLNSLAPVPSLRLLSTITVNDWLCEPCQDKAAKPLTSTTIIICLSKPPRKLLLQVAPNPSPCS